MTPRVKALIRHYRYVGRVKAKVRSDKRKGKRGCMVWRGAISTSDDWGFYEYGIVQNEGKRTFAHRVLWEDKHGPLNGRILRNVCGNTLCCTPEHWEAMHHWRRKEAPPAKAVQGTA
jgi:hypothetical protein